MQIYLLIALIFALCVALFAVQNAAPVDIKFLVYQFKGISLVIVILISVLFGALIVVLLGLVKQISLLKRVHALEKQNEFLEQEINEINLTKENLEQQETLNKKDDINDTDTMV